MKKPELSKCWNGNVVTLGYPRVKVEPPYYFVFSGSRRHITVDGKTTLCGREAESSGDPLRWLRCNQCTDKFVRIRVPEIRAQRKEQEGVTKG